MLCNNTNARSPPTFIRANSSPRGTIASAVAIVGNATNTPPAPDTRPNTDAACNAASVFPSPVGAVTSTNPEPRSPTNPGKPRSTLSCNAFAENGNCPANDRAGKTADPSPASPTTRSAASTASRQCAANSFPSPAQPSVGNRSAITDS